MYKENLATWAGSKKVKSGREADLKKREIEILLMKI